MPCMLEKNTGVHGIVMKLAIKKRNHITNNTFITLYFTN